jgi:hypothetical protein
MKKDRKYKIWENNKIMQGHNTLHHNQTIFNLNWKYKEIETHLK